MRFFVESKYDEGAVDEKALAKCRRLRDKTLTRVLDGGKDVGPVARLWTTSVDARMLERSHATRRMFKKIILI